MIVACKKQAVSNKPPCNVQTFSISPLPSNKPPSNKPPCQITKLTISPRGLNRGFTILPSYGRKRYSAFNGRMFTLSSNVLQVHQVKSQKEA